MCAAIFKIRSYRPVFFYNSNVCKSILIIKNKIRPNILTKFLTNNCQTGLPTIHVVPQIALSDILTADKTPRSKPSVTDQCGRGKK